MNKDVMGVQEVSPGYEFVAENPALPVGYKQTEVGVIPEDWDVFEVGEASSKVGSGVTPTGGSRIYKSSGRPFVRSQNVGWGCLELNDIAYIDESIHETFLGTEIHKEDVLLNITGASIGRAAIADSRVVGGNVNQHVCIIRPKKDVLEPRFLGAFLISSHGQRQIDSFQAGGNRQGLNFKQVSSIHLPAPQSVEEQRAIATALSDVDALLEELDRLIAKKRDIKQAAMQQLLTGETRLPGFEGEWVTKQLGDYCSLKSGVAITSSSITLHSQYPCYGGNGLRGFTDIYTHEGEYALIGRQGALCGNVANVSGKFFASEHALVVTANQHTNIHWLALVLRRMALNKYSESSAQPGLSARKLLLLEVFGPPIKEEQQAIAAVLSDMDTEIQALEHRRSKTAELKQGMMQELLTGRTRLV